MSHIKRYLFVFATPVIALLIGGSGFADEIQSQVEDQRPAKVAYQPPRIDLSALGGEVPNTHPTQRCITLGVGEYFSEHFADAVREMAPQLTGGDVDRIAEHLSSQLEGQGSGVDSRKLDAGVSACVMRKPVEGRAIANVDSWYIYLGKNSGILQEG